MSSKSQFRNLFVAGLLCGLASGKAFAIGVPLQTHEGFLTTEYQTVFTNLKLDDVQTFGATLMGNRINSGSPHGLVTLGTWFKGVGTRLATAGRDLAITGTVTVDADAAGNDTLWLDATDADGTARTMTFSAAISGSGKLGVCGGEGCRERSS